MKVRPATANDLLTLPDIERSAALAFRGSSQDAIADGAVSPVDFYIPFQTDGLVLVAEDHGLLGFAACQACADGLHLWELAVRQEWQGQGVGRQLMRATIELARLRGLPAVTLSTFRHIAWNAPFYAQLGRVSVCQIVALAPSREAHYPSNMPKGPRGEKRPADAIGAAVMVGRIATGEIEESPAAVAPQRKGGTARAARLTPEERSEIARRAAEVRWAAKTK
ncbi:GNAT family N-acetyltransferase [Phenylobacterium sp.]|uniref:GNAT family N-acetyltransferase n=1 Tax=Phenylobacterium sp. TaxID=1871053 RepID=UPI00286C5849|nr:GNAT family N-acetyltransferase [Phenylobacterium sp.]